MSEIYGFYHVSCIYESGAKLQSAHRTKRGAWKAMNKYLNDKFLHRMNLRILHGKKNYRGEKTFQHELWFIEPIEVKE